MPDSIKCSKCDQEFTDEEAHKIHMNIDHGVNEVADSFQFTDSKKPLDEQEFLASNGVRGYNPNPNAGLYDNKLFRVGSSTERTSILGESYANEETEYTGGDFCAKCGTEFEDKGECKVCNGESDTAYKSMKRDLDTLKGLGDYNPNDSDDGKKLGMSWQDGGEASDEGFNSWYYSTNWDKNSPELNIDLKEKTLSYFGLPEAWAYLKWEDIPQHGKDKISSESKASDDYEVDVDEYLKTGEPVQKIPTDKRTDEESYASEDDLDDIMSKDPNNKLPLEGTRKEQLAQIRKYLRNSEEVDYDKEDEQTMGFIEQQHTEPKEDNNKELDDVDISEESIDYVYPTKASEARERSYTTEAKMVEGLEEEYDDFEDSDEEEVTETVTLRKLHGFSNESIARELHITYGVPHEEALEKVHSIEVSTNDKVAQTFFGKMYKECNESEKAELRMYSGSD